jgi:hypothetical protein
VSLQCISDSPWDVAKFALTTNSDPLEGPGARDGSGGNQQKFGYLIHSVEAGNWTVKLLNPADRKRFAPGRYVCILSFDQQFGGYPPNCRYFECAVLEAVSAGSITLDRPLQFEHSGANFRGFRCSRVHRAGTHRSRGLAQRYQDRSQSSCP